MRSTARVAPVDDLAAWLTQIWDGLEAFARKAGGDVWTLDGGIYRKHPTHEVVDWVYDDADEHIAANDPASVLARIAADRQILELHTGAHDCQEIRTGTYSDDWPEFIPWGTAGGQWRHPGAEYFEEGEPCPTVRLLALPHADRPGYQGAWRPQ